MDFEGTDNAVTGSPAEEPTSLDTAPAPETEGGEPQGSDTEAPEQQLDDEGNPLPEEDDFEWDGEKHRLPKKLADSLREGALMRSDYTKKTQEVAEQRRELAGEHARLVQHAEAIKAGTEGLQNIARADAVISSLRQQYDHALQNGDPNRALNIQKDINAWENHKSETMNWLGNVQQRIVSSNDAATQQRWAETNAKLSKEFPGWGKGELNSKVSKWAVEQGGFTPDQVRNITHHPVARTLVKAFLYDQSQSSKKPAAPQKPAPEPTRQIAPGQTAPASRNSFQELAKKSDPTEAIRLRRAQRAKEGARG